MSLKVVKGNIFTSRCQTIVNTVNCVGVMGAGIALECRLRYPEMYEKYVEFCRKGEIKIGLLWLYRSPERWVLNFPTKKHWKNPSEKKYLHDGLKNFCDTYKKRGIESIAFPLLGADKGGINQEESLEIMMFYLEKTDIDIEIYRYDPKAKDDLYDITKEKILSKSASELSEKTKLRIDYVEKLIVAFERDDVFQLNQIARLNGIGIKTLEKLFAFSRMVSVDSVDSGQLPLFFDNN